MSPGNIGVSDRKEEKILRFKWGAAVSALSVPMVTGTERQCCKESRTLAVCLTSLTQRPLREQLHPNDLNLANGFKAAALEDAPLD